MSLKRWSILNLSLGLGLLPTLAVIRLFSWATVQDIPQSVNSAQHFFPPYANPRDRFGFDSGPLDGYDVAQLHAGWYSNWGANLHPAHPDHLVYVQLIRFNADAAPHDPEQVTVNPDKETIARIAALHPGSLWLMSNEPDSIYQGDPILPEVYAVVYHDYYEYIKGLDPSAQIANGGIVQPTPCRLAYLDIVWETFLKRYGEPMPVDAWNIHTFILREVYGEWGASTPPGVDPQCGMDYAVDDGDDIQILHEHLLAMRQWMKDKGYQDKPLIITEYGVLWPEWFAPQYTPARVSQFMIQSFELFLNTQDFQVGYPADDYRLVQAWAWYSLSDDKIYNGYLFHSDSKTLSQMGEAYAAYTAALTDSVQIDLSARLETSPSPSELADIRAGSASSEPLNVTMTGTIANLGKLAAEDTVGRFQILRPGGGTLVLGRDVTHTVPARFDGLVRTAPVTATLIQAGRYVLGLDLDPEDRIDEPREWNNIATTTLDLRPDVTPHALDYHLSGSFDYSATLLITSAVRNQGAWYSPATSGTLYLEPLPHAAPITTQAHSIPPLAVGSQAQQVAGLSWSAPDRDLYRLILRVDEEDRLSEQEEDNNVRSVVVPMTVKITLSPTATTVFTSVAGTTRLIFSSGTVSRPTQIVYAPMYVTDWQTDSLNMSTAAFALKPVGDGAPLALRFTRPVTVTWFYSDADIVGLGLEHIRLFASTEQGVWQDASCAPYQRDPGQNRITTAICRSDSFVFGTQYDALVPAVFSEAAIQPSFAEPGTALGPLMLPLKQVPTRPAGLENRRSHPGWPGR